MRPVTCKSVLSDPHSLWVRVILIHSSCMSGRCDSAVNDPDTLWIWANIIHSHAWSCRFITHLVGACSPGVCIFVSECEVLDPLVAATLPTGHVTLKMSQYHTFPCMVMPYHHIHVSSLSDSLMQWQLILMHVVECKSAWNDPHPSMDMRHSQSFSAILMHSHAFTVLVAFL